MELKIISCPVHGTIPQNPCYEFDYQPRRAKSKSFKMVQLRYVICKSCECGYYSVKSSADNAGLTDEIQCESLILKPGITNSSMVLDIKKPQKVVVCPIHRVEVMRLIKSINLQLSL